MAASSNAQGGDFTWRFKVSKVCLWTLKPHGIAKGERTTRIS